MLDRILIALHLKKPRGQRLNLPPVWGETLVAATQAHLKYKGLPPIEPCPSASVEFEFGGKVYRGTVYEVEDE